MNDDFVDKCLEERASWSVLGGSSDRGIIVSRVHVFGGSSAISEMDYATSTTRRPLLQEEEEDDSEATFVDDSIYAGSINAGSINNIPTTATVGTRGGTWNRRLDDGNLRIPPVDKYNFTYAVFYLLGMTTLLPWNFFVTAEEVCRCVCISLSLLSLIFFLLSVLALQIS